MRPLDQLDFEGRTVLVRVDFNVPLAAGGVITDDTRIRAALPTLERLLSGGAEKLVLMSHLGRPKLPEPSLSLRPVAARASELLGRAVTLLPMDLREAAQRVADAPPRSVFMLENTRFYPGEEKNDSELAQGFAQLGQVYVDDAFGSAHRAHASTEGVARLLPSAAGLLLEREVRELSRLLADPERPYVAVLGGAKVSDKIGVIRSLLPRVDKLLIGGAMANTFLVARGQEVGKSLVEPESVGVARQLLEGEGRDKLVLPVDAVVARSLDTPETAQAVPVDAVPPDAAIYDVGPETVRLYADHLTGARTVFWNGPLGVFEVERFAEGTYGIARAVADADAHTVVGGGDSVAALERSGYADRIDHISTGGGASLELLEGQTLPGVAVLEAAGAAGIAGASGQHAGEGARA